MADTFPAAGANAYRALLEVTALREGRRLQPELTAHLTDSDLLADPIVGAWLGEAWREASAGVSMSHTAWIHQQTMLQHGLSFVDGPTEPPEFPDAVPAAWEARLLAALLLGLDEVTISVGRGFGERWTVNLRPFHAPPPEIGTLFKVFRVPAWDPRP